MGLIDCTDITIVLKNLQSGDDKLINGTLDCLYEMFIKHLKSEGERICYNRGGLIRHNREEIVYSSFAKTLNSLYTNIKAGRFTDLNIPVKLVLRSFFIKRLLWEIQDYKEPVHGLGFDSDSYFKETPEVPNGDFEFSEEEIALFKKAFDKLLPRCQKLIVWRKKLNLGDDEIAFLDGKISPNSVTNEVYRCMGRLKIIVQHLQKTK